MQDNFTPEPNVTYNMVPNRINKIYYQAQREVKLLHPDISYEEYCVEVNQLWEQLAKEKGMDIYDQKYYDEPMEWIPVDEPKWVETEVGKQYVMEMNNE